MTSTMLLWNGFANLLWMFDRVIGAMLVWNVLAVFLRNMLWYIMATLLGNLGTMFLWDMLGMLNFKRQKYSYSLFISC